MVNEDEFDQDQNNSDFAPDTWKKKRQREYNLFTKKVYHHPYFTYCIEPPDQYKSKDYISCSEANPFKIPIQTVSDWEYKFGPKDINEEIIQTGFCILIQRLSPSEIPEFLNYQYEQYLDFSDANPDPEAFLNYIIATIEGYKNPVEPNWRPEAFWSLMAVSKWIRNHPGYSASFDLRLKNWINLDVGFREVFEESKKDYFQKFDTFLFSYKPEEIIAKLDQAYEDENEFKNVKPGENHNNFFRDHLIKLNKYLPLDYKIMKDSRFLTLRAAGEWINSHPSINAEIRDWSEHWLAEIGTYESFVVEKARAKLNQAEQKVTNNQQTITNPVPTITSDHNRVLVAEKLRHLSGYWRSRKIITDEDYHRLVSYVYFLIKNNKLPPNIIQIKINFPVGHIRASFVNLYYTTVQKISKKELWVDFLCAVFPTEFSETTNKQTTLTKFAPSQNPDSFEKDVENILKNLGRE